MEMTRNKPKELLPYRMLLTSLFKHVVFVFPELAIDHYLSHDRVMHPLVPHYEQKTRSDHGKKRPHESNASSSSTALNHPSSSRPLDDAIDSIKTLLMLNTYLFETINLQTRQQDAHREGLSIKLALPCVAKPSFASSFIQTMLCQSITSFSLFNSPNSHTSSPPLSSSSSSPSSLISCSNHHFNFSRNPRMSVRQVWKHKTSTPKSSPLSQNDSPPHPLRFHFQSPSPPSYNPLRDQTINQLHNIFTILDSHTKPSNAYIHAPPSPPPQPIHLPLHP
nr:hypothetical protein [Tanacetum cinerariifolium]